jgi:hypothetical protein
VFLSGGDKVIDTEFKPREPYFVAPNYLVVRVSGWFDLVRGQ